MAAHEIFDWSVDPVGDRPRQSFRFYGRARFALLEAFRVIGIGAGDKVLFPGFICRELLAAAHECKAEPVFYKVDENLTPCSLCSNGEAKAIVAVNYFGFSQPLEPFREYCGRFGATLIEDNAHGFHSRDGEGQLLGTRGDIGIFSLRKTHVIPDGGALVVNRTDWVDRLSPAQGCRRDSLPFGHRFKQFLRRVQTLSGLRVISACEAAVRTVRRMRTGQPFPVSPPNQEFQLEGDQRIHLESLAALQQIDEAREVKRRRNLFQRFQDSLQGEEIQPLFSELGPGTAPYGFAFRASAIAASRIARVAASAGFCCAPWPDLPAAIAAKAPPHYRNVWWINF